MRRVLVADTCRVARCSEGRKGSLGSSPDVGYVLLVCAQGGQVTAVSGHSCQAQFHCMCVRM